MGVRQRSCEGPSQSVWLGSVGGLRDGHASVESQSPHPHGARGSSRTRVLGKTTRAGGDRRGAWQDFSAGAVGTSGDRGRALGTMTQNTLGGLSCDVANRLRDKDGGP